ncbi:zinc finger, C2H2 type, partial [Opisthorchis viverrini]
MIEQNLLSGKSLIISSFNPNLSTSPSTHILTAGMTNPAFMTYGRGTNGSDLNLIALMQNMRPEAQNLCRSLAQHLNATPILELGSPAISQLLAASCKRVAPNLQPSVIEAHQPSTSTEEDVIKCPTQGPSSFSMTAAITSALSSNSVAAGSQLLPACSPLLQLAIRQALGECLPNFSPLSIHGNLEISFEGTTPNGMQRHALKHVGFKPFECRVCSKAYYRKDHLMRHMEMGHPGYTPRDNITVHLTSSESLDFLNRSCPMSVNEDVEDALNTTMIRRDSLMEVDSTPQPSTPEHEVAPVTSAIDSDNHSPCNDVSTEDRVESDHRDSIYSSTGAPSSVEFSERCASSVEDLPPFITQTTEQPGKYPSVAHGPTTAVPTKKISLPEKEPLLAGHLKISFMFKSIPEK